MDISQAREGKTFDKQLCWSTGTAALICRNGEKNTGLGRYADVFILLICCSEPWVVINDPVTICVIV